jgi:hypothetical protein
MGCYIVPHIVILFEDPMTAIEVAFKYGKQPGPAELRALDSVREVYGIRKLWFNEPENVVRVEYDRTRLNDDTIAALLRRAGMDIKEKLVLA